MHVGAQIRCNVTLWIKLGADWPFPITGQEFSVELNFQCAQVETFENNFSFEDSSASSIALRTDMFCL